MLRTIATEHVLKAVERLFSNQITVRNCNINYMLTIIAAELVVLKLLNDNFSIKS